MGNTLCFIYGSNYLASSYSTYAASALAGATVMRSIFGATLPLAGPALYTALTPRWAGTLLGLLEVVMVPVPFVFLRYGERIRGRSRVIRMMREERERGERRMERNRVKREGREKEEGEGKEKGVVVVEEGSDEMRAQAAAQGAVVA